MNESEEARLKLYDLYTKTAEKISDRRAHVNTWMLSVNSAIASLYGYARTDKMSVDAAQQFLSFLFIPASGILVCLAWISLLVSYRKLNRAKYFVIKQIEVQFPIAPFTEEQEVYHADKRRSLADIEKVIPFIFILLYLVVIAARIVSFLK